MTTTEDDVELADQASSERVLRVAERLFLEQGYGDTTIREIASASKVSNATIVKYFGGKPGLFVAVVGVFTARLIGAAAIEFGDRPEHGLKTWGAAVLRLLLEPRMVTAAQHLYSEVFTLPDLVQTYYEIGPGKLASNLSAQLHKWSDEGLFPEQDFLVAAEWFMHLISGGVYHRMMMGLQMAASDDEVDATVEEAVRIFFAAFGRSNLR